MSATYSVMSSVLDERPKPLFMTLMEWLGVRLFKKYWPVEGSVWNTIHTDPKSIASLTRIITMSNNYTSEHIQHSAREIISIIACGFWMPTKRTQLYFAATVMSIYHGYALAVHQYNRMAARIAIANLPTPPPIEGLIRQDNHPIYSQRTYSGGYLVSAYGDDIGPIFEVELEAKQFVEFLRQVPRHAIAIAACINRGLSLYNAWVASQQREPVELPSVQQ